ncbi:hypothetical protein CK203_023233 [Vitis vinifera]|uniref:Uncharacterized protein n=1 Tax=Vitis vinifera TaxID=29760 RepID=A0A438J1Y2_VITVI|nr:hypothetical protein CK203_023233 [Vitis vinifera]
MSITQTVARNGLPSTRYAQFATSRYLARNQGTNNRKQSLPFSLLGEIFLFVFPFFGFSLSDA